MPAYEFHPLADAFPMMSDLEFERLKQDIDENGQKEPIIVFQGKILDGRNRYRACMALKIEPLTEAFKGSIEEARELSTSENLMRRHLSKSQQAMFLVLEGYLAPPAPRGRRRKFDGGDKSPREIGKRYGVNHMTLYKAADIAGRDKALAQKVLKGDLSVGAAELLLKKRESEKNTGRKKKNAALTGRQLPERLKKVFQAVEELELVDAAVKQARRSVKSATESGVFADSDVREIRAALNTISNKIKRNKPRSVCTKCKGKGCSDCANRGWLPENL